jgi:PST family polysaccharide transporter
VGVKNLLLGKRVKSSDNYKEFLSTETLCSDLKGRSIRGGLYTMVGDGVSNILRLVSIAILARILIPEDFGLISMVTALTVIAERFKDLGLATATVQKKEINHQQVSALFWINVIVGALLMIVVCALSKLIAWFYGDDRLIWITVGISLTFLFGGMTVQHQALLKRRLEFFKITTINIVAEFLSICITVILALMGYGYWALVWKEITRSVFVIVGTWLSCPWLPGLWVRNVKIGGMMRFGRDITGFNLINFLTKNLDQILIGKFYGPGLLGIFRQAYQLILTPLGQIVSPVQNVAEPALSLLQDDPVRYRQYYKKILLLLSIVTMPLVVFLFIYSRHIILLVLGERWMQAAEIFRILAISAFILPVAGTTGFVMITCGKTKRFFILGLTSSVIFIVGMSIGVRWGVVGIAVANVLSTYIYFVPLIFLSFRQTPVSAGLFFRSILPSVICSMLMGIVLFLFSNIISIQSSFNAIVSSVPIALIAYFLAWILLPRGRLRLKEIFSDFLFTFKKRRMQEFPISPR